MTTIGKRLRNERERLALSQEAIGEIGGVGRRAQVRYEADERCPDGHYLAAIAAAGADVGYILTGARAATQTQMQSQAQTGLNPREAALLDNFRACDEGDQDAIHRMAIRSAEAQHKDVKTAKKKKAG